MKKSTIEKTGDPESVFLSEFQKDGRIQRIIEKSRSYAVKLNRILKTQETGGNLFQTVDHVLRNISVGINLLYIFAIL